MVVTVDELLITGIQRFSVHDGPGIRTTVFLKGCTLRCPWCCNPENIRGEPEVYFKAEKCIGCLECLKKCSFLDKPEDIFRFPEHHECAGSCPSGAMGVYGEVKGADDVAEVILRDLDYYSSTGGGVTFSGGSHSCRPGQYEALPVEQVTSTQQLRHHSSPPWNHLRG